MEYFVWNANANTTEQRHIILVKSSDLHKSSLAVAALVYLNYIVLGLLLIKHIFLCYMKMIRAENVLAN